MKRYRMLLLLAGIIGAVVAFSLMRANRPPQPFTRSFTATGIKKVILRAEQADKAKISAESINEVRVTGLPSGGAAGYHSSDPFWRETPPQEQGLDFIAKRFGNVLVISTKKEISYVHHYYALKNISLRVPHGVIVEKEKRMLNGEIAPDLRKP